MKSNHRNFRPQYEENINTTWSEDSIRFINTPTPFAKSSFFYVQEAGYFKADYPYFTQRRNLNSFLLIVTHSGKGILEYHGHTYECVPGSVLFINCMDTHLYHCIPESEWMFQWLHFNGVSSQGYYEAYLQQHAPVFVPGSDTHGAIRTYMEHILASSMNRNAHSEIMISGMITSLLTALVTDQYPDAHCRTSELSDQTIPVYIKKAVSYIEGHFSESLSLDVLTKKVGISKYYFSREFKKYMGISPHEYLTITRISYAKNCLKSSDASIEQIAVDCGYNYTSHFINMFTGHEKLTPLQYRMQWK